MIKKKQTLEEAIKSDKVETPPVENLGKVAAKSNDFSPDKILQDLLETTGIQAAFYRAKVSGGIMLGDKEQIHVSRLAGNMQILGEEYREQIKMAKYDKMNEDDLIKTLKEAILNWPEEKYIAFVGELLEKRPVV